MTTTKENTTTPTADDYKKYSKSFGRSWFPATYRRFGYADLSFPCNSIGGARGLIHELVDEGYTSWGGELTVERDASTIIETMHYPTETELAFYKRTGHKYRE